MIATILPSSSNFHAVLYNESKVAKGTATLLEIKNMGSIDVLGYEDPKELQDYLINYSERNPRVKNAQFHLAISCKGDEMTHDQLLDFAHKYLSEMGYDDPEQPLLVYAHHDTANNHIHIITSRVAPNGKKINDSNERRRSQKAIEKILGQDARKKVDKDLADAKLYNFSTMRQYKSILEAMGYQCFEKGEELCVKRSGMVQVKIPKLEIENIIAYNLKHKKQLSEADKKKWRAILLKCRDISVDKISFEKEIRSQFGLSIIWLGPKDNPFGYQIVDFRNKAVYEGNSIINIRSLLKFKTAEEHKKEIQALIDKCLDENPYITTKELNSKLRRAGAYVRKNTIYFAKDKMPLEENLRVTLERNNKIAFRQSFHPASEAEREVICRFTNYDHPELIKIEPIIPGTPYKKKECEDLFRLLVANKTNAEKRAALEEAGYTIYKNEKGVYFVNLQTHTIIDMSRIGIPTSLYTELVQPKQTDKVKSTYTNKPGQGQSRGRGPAGGSGYGNREWEVGKHGLDRDDPDRGLGY